MPIISSEIREDAAQIDGRRYIREVHTDRLGIEHHVVYLADANANAEATMAARAEQMYSDMLQQHESQESQNGLYPE